MKNEELKKKICDIIAPYVSAYGDDERIADALIVAGIGDLKEHRIFAGKDGSIKQLYSGEEVEKMAKERKELKDELRSKVEYIHEQDEVVKEYKHRAEVAEKELLVYKEVAGAMLCEIDCSNEGYCPEFYKDPECENCTKKKIYGNFAATFPCLLDKYIQQAEKELAEEGKDD